MLLLTLALAAPAHFTQQEFAALVEAGRQDDWHANRSITQLTLDGDKASVFHMGSFLECTVEGDVVTCPQPGGDPWTLTRKGDEVVADGLRLVPTTWSMDDLWSRLALEEGRTQLAKVKGTWRRGDARRVFDDEALSDRRALRLEPCHHDDVLTVCASIDQERHVLTNDRFVPARIFGDCGCEGEAGHDWVGFLTPGAPWVRDTPCTRGVCSVTHRIDGEGLRHVPLGDRIDELAADATPLWGHRAQVEAGPGVDRVTARVRTLSQVLVHDEDFSDDASIDGLLGVGPWVEVPVSDHLQVPSDLPTVPVTADAEQLLAALRAGLPPDVADETYRARFEARLRTCTSPSSAPCRMAVGAVEHEVVAWKGDTVVDRVTWKLFRDPETCDEPLGCREGP